MKRARHVSAVSSEFLPITAQSIGSAEWVYRPKRPAEARSLRSLLPTKPGAWAVLAAFVVFGATVCVTGYFAVQEIDDESGRPGMASVETGLPGGATLPPRVDASAETPAETPPTPIASDGDDPSRIERAVTPPPAIAARRASQHKATDPRIAQAAISGTDRLPPRAGDADSAQRPSEDADSTTRVITPTPVVAAVEPAVPDRWQALNAALARCSNESFLAGVVCGERARHQYCDGYWGQVPQCRGYTHTEISR